MMTAERESTHQAELVEWLREQTWSDFARDLVAFYDGKGYLTDRQADAAQRMRDKAQSRTSAQPRVDYTALVPEGRYALDDEEGQVKFYKITHGQAGSRWEGFAFVDVQASDDFHPQRGHTAGEILRRIADDPQEAAIRYGKEIGICGVCGITLTREDSRARGIGPICAKRFGL